MTNEYNIKNNNNNLSLSDFSFSKVRPGGSKRTPGFLFPNTYIFTEHFKYGKCCHHGRIQVSRCVVDSSATRVYASATRDPREVRARRTG